MNADNNLVEESDISHVEDDQGSSLINSREEIELQVENVGEKEEEKSEEIQSSVEFIDQQFQQLSVQDEDKPTMKIQTVASASSSISLRFPSCPGMGRFGEKCIVKASHFFVELPDKDLHQYDVSITPEVTSRGVNQAIIKEGLFGNVFCDFGPGFTVFDVDGEEPHTGIIATISNDNPAIVSCVDDERLEFQDGDLVVFSGVKGMTELNDGRPRKVINARSYTFSLEEDTTHFCSYDRGGMVTQVKQPKILQFKTLRDSLKDPGDFILTDFSKYDRPPLLHLAFQALDKFRHDFGRFPVAGSEKDVQRLRVSSNSTCDCQGSLASERYPIGLLVSTSASKPMEYNACTAKISALTAVFPFFL